MEADPKLRDQYALKQIGQKRCGACGHAKPLEQFYCRLRGAKQYKQYDTICKPCRVDYITRANIERQRLRSERQGM